MEAKRERGIRKRIRIRIWCGRLFEPNAFEARNYKNELRTYSTPHSHNKNLLDYPQIARSFSQRVCYFMSATSECLLVFYIDDGH